MTKPVTAWAAIQMDGDYVIFSTIASTRREAYDKTNEGLDTHLSARGLRKIGFIIKRVRITTEE